MNILIITKTTQPNSGWGRYSKEVVRELRAQGETVVVLAESGERNASLRPGHGPLSLLLNSYKARAAARSADIVHALDAWPLSIYGLFAVLGTRRKQLYINGVGTYSVPPKRISLKRFLMRAAYRRSKHVFCISAYTQMRIRQQLPFTCPLSVVTLGATKLPQPDADTLAEVRRRHRIEPDAEIVLTVGEIKDRKGQLDTFRAILDLRKARPKLVYVMLGNDGDPLYIEAIKQAAAEAHAQDAYRIVTDASSDMLLAAWFAMADIFVLASNNEGDHFEGFGLVFLEAGQFGVPGIGTKNCGIEDAIVDGVTGMLVPQRDSRAIEVAIETVMKKRGEFGTAARAFSETFSWQKTVEAYRCAYGTLT